MKKDSIGTLFVRSIVFMRFKNTESTRAIRYCDVGGASLKKEGELSLTQKI